MSTISLQAIKEFHPERFTKRILFQHNGGVTFALHFLPGQQLPVHKHPGTDVIVLVMEGEGTLSLDGVEQEIRQEDVVCCSGEDTFAFHNTGSREARLFVVLSKVPDESYARDV
ncbi:cupin domain-containing protein [Paenibacillus xylanilyticus]|uniref:Cupin domain-containing protein n=1 Tax=Paenibacillus xylanilyticus TaxID=248903 RepID=A0A7Y6C2C6_9BACL|nr:cupin domain-containing protein [Paenibacillus xylanilyticus]NUU78319.1 cupin domain-containing protein [Paenibacillus xylanilyticus]